MPGLEGFHKSPLRVIGDFVHSVRAIDRPGTVKVLHVTIAQAPRGRFTQAFVDAFRLTDWSRFPNGSDWPE
jgi:hypothetical protein